MKLDVHTLEAKKSGSIELDDAVFGIAPDDIRRDILHRMVRYQLAKRRRGTHRAKERGEIARTSKKFGRQKGGGGARHGSRRSGIFVGGAKAHTPKPRDYAFDLPKKVRKLALRHALSAKAGAQEIVVLSEASLSEPKTKALKPVLQTLAGGDALVVCGPAVDVNFARAAQNLPKVDVVPVQGVNVYDVLRRRTLVLTKDAVAAIDAFFAGQGWPVQAASDGDEKEAA